MLKWSHDHTRSAYLIKKKNLTCVAKAECILEHTLEYTPETKKKKENAFLKNQNYFPLFVLHKWLEMYYLDFF